ncbi:MAG: hypothetical protein WCG92_06175 [Hyphomicrobiales bacterium]|nr:hypothetical protein [Alphaproteobacteria bacterium]
MFGVAMIRPAPLLIAGLIVVALTASAVAQQAPTRRMAEPPSPYFMEFRARSGGALGHTFIAYGRVDGRGRVLQERHAGLYPNDEYHESILPVLMPVSAYIKFGKEDARLSITAAYRRRLTAAEYMHLQETLRYLQGSEHRWNLFFYNCNEFASQVAREMGLWTMPGGLMQPNVFVTGLRTLNGPQ